MMNKPEVKLVECPRDAMQGLADFVPTKIKASYINLLLQVGFDTIDFGSFVSPKAVPQMKDTAELLKQLNMEHSYSKLLAIVANERGAEEAASFEEISYLGFPLSVSETFQMRNTNKSIAQAMDIVKNIQDICVAKNKTQVVYLSMGFGNPYGDPYSKDYIVDFVHKLDQINVQIISLSDTIGVSDKANIDYLFKELIPAFPNIEFGAHLHSHPKEAYNKIQYAYEAGCRRFDGAMKGFGGCPMAKDDLVGNIATEAIIDYLSKLNVNLNLNKEKFALALQKATEVFPL
ncbi:MAG: hydroxymethylglutaryl-CoA lyase [Cytophagaceae bacterium]